MTSIVPILFGFNGSFVAVRASDARRYGEMRSRLGRLYRPVNMYSGSFLLRQKMLNATQDPSPNRRTEGRPGPELLSPRPLVSQVDNRNG